MSKYIDASIIIPISCHIFANNLALEIELLGYRLHVLKCVSMREREKTLSKGTPICHNIVLRIWGTFSVIFVLMGLLR